MKPVVWLPSQIYSRAASTTLQLVLTLFLMNRRRMEVPFLLLSLPTPALFFAGVATSPCHHGRIYQRVCLWPAVCAYMPVRVVTGVARIFTLVLRKHSDQMFMMLSGWWALKPFQAWDPNFNLHTSLMAIQRNFKGCPFQGCLLSTLIPDIGHWLAWEKWASQRYKMGSSYRFPLLDLIFLQVIKITFYFMDSISCSVYKHVGKVCLSEFTSFGFLFACFLFLIGG